MLRRHGVVFPWGSPPPPDAPGKELYLVPLHPSDSVPEYLQLLDHVQLPDPRNTTMVLGLFVLHRPKAHAPQSSAILNTATASDGVHANNAAQFTGPSGIDISSITAEYLAGILQNPALNQILGAAASTSDVIVYPPPSNAEILSNGTFSSSQTSAPLQTLHPSSSTPASANQPMGRFYGNAQPPLRGRSPDQ